MTISTELRFVARSIIHHSGILTFSLIDALLTKFKYVSQDYDIKFAVYKKILTVMIESLENVCKYTDHYQEFVEDKQEFLPTFEIIMNSENIKLSTSNPVKNSDVEELTRKIELVNNRSRQELRDLYLETITNGQFSEKGGAGLGFIEMAKTSGNNLAYTFQKISKDYSLYTFVVTFDI